MREGREENRSCPACLCVGRTEQDRAWQGQRTENREQEGEKGHRGRRHEGGRTEGGRTKPVLLKSAVYVFLGRHAGIRQGYTHIVGRGLQAEV